MARVLSFQSTYSCRRSGACCTSNWPIPVEADRLARLHAAVASGSLSAGGRRPGAWLRRRESDADPPLLAADHGRCVFFDSDGHRCAIHTALGHDALPLSCRQFPRVSVHDPRGTSVVLSCYCPTAAALLDAPGPVTILDSPPAFPDRGEYVGLETRQGWPPMLRPGVLMDWRSWWMFEARAVNLIGNVAASPDDAMRRIAAVVARVRAWAPGGVDLQAEMAAAFDRADGQRPDDAPFDAERRGRRVASLHASIPREWTVSPTPRQPACEPPARRLRFLACHAFANWAVHLGQDVEAWLESLSSAHALLASGFSVREADLWLRHLTPVAGLRETAT